MAAMDLQCRLEHGEGRWGQDEAMLLERFDAERKEWESQLRDMQKNIEELYNEVKARREGNTTGLDSRTQDSFPPNTEKSAQSAPPSHPCNGYFDPTNHHSNGIKNPLDRHANAGSIALQDRYSNDGYDPVGCHSNGCSYPNHHSNGCSHPADHYSHGRRDSVEVELEDILHSCLGQGLKHIPSSCGQSTSIRATNGCQSMEHSQPRHACNNDKRQKNTCVVNSALKDIARVSEDLCSYQDVIRKKSRSEADSVLVEEVENVKNKQPAWGNQWGNNSRETANRSSNKADMGVKPSSWKAEAPPIPPRNTSWCLNSSTSPEPQLPVQESFTNKKCHSPCVLTDRKCTSPSVLRKFEAMLQENEGKTLTDSGVLANIVPADSKCNTGSFHCRVGNPKSSTFVPVQKWPPEGCTLATEIDCRLTDSQKFPRGQFQPVDRETRMPMDSRGSTKGPWRSPTVAQKGVGQGFEEENVILSEMGVSSRPRGVNSYPPVQSVENSEGRKHMGSAWESRFQAVNEKPFRPTAPASHAQTQDFWSSCREEEPNLRGYECSDRFQQGQKWGPNGSGHHDDLIELLGMLGIEHQSDTPKTHPQAPCQQETPQESQRSSVSMKKGFSRPARPANRRPPSRWAGRVPSVPVTHVTPFPDSAHKQTLSPYSYQTETVIM
ncbi:hypothetical protein SKAU_G00196810 [Synaphobranchus kaupii]|uniref:SOGA 1/2-like coiled-coil domain-containing protein n=1 Tax=Synaphobranchus kaupii TaxID=118154 RepID=A0A9Q1IVR1_SYNKA|nr:hypothetical protein SKAU_G00196810 [Synaphobranchus kaupii]